MSCVIQSVKMEREGWRVSSDSERGGDRGGREGAGEREREREGESTKSRSKKTVDRVGSTKKKKKK